MFEINDDLLLKYTGPGGDVVIPDGVRSIGEDVFLGCVRLTSVVIPSGVTSIGNYAFWNCSSLKSVVIPSGVMSIGNGAFKDCRGLKSVVIPSGVTSIGNEVFFSCIALTSVVIPSGVMSIGNYAFMGCVGLTSVVIPSGVTNIGGGAFWGCSGLKSVVIPSGVTSISVNAFDNCAKLDLIVVPDSEIERITQLLPSHIRGKVVKESFFNKVKEVEDNAYRLVLNPLMTSSLYGFDRKLDDLLSTISYLAEEHKERFTKAISEIALPRNEDDLAGYRQALEEVAFRVREEIIQERQIQIVDDCVGKLEKYLECLQLSGAREEARSPGFFKSHPDVEKKLGAIAALIKYVRGDSEVFFSAEDKETLKETFITEVLEMVNLKPADLPSPESAGFVPRSS